MRKSKVNEGDPRTAIRKKRYHPMAYYIIQREIEQRRLNGGAAGRFHKLASKLERYLPRGIREKGDMNYSTTCLILEVDNEH